MTFGVLLDRSHALRTSWLDDGTGVLIDVFDRGTDFIGADDHKVVNQRPGQAHGFFANQFHRSAVRKQAHIGQGHTLASLDGTHHRVRVTHLHADDLDLGSDGFDIGSHTADQATTADGHKHGIDRAAVLTQDLHGDGALTCDHIRIVKGMHKGHALFLFQLFGVQGRIRVALTMQHDLHVIATEMAHGIDLHLRRGGRHHDGGLAAQSSCAHRDALRMVAR